MPSLPIERGWPAPGLLAHVLVAKYADHTPLYRQSLIDARRLGRPGELAVAAVGRTARGACLRRCQDPRRRHAGAGLDPGRGRTKKGRLWVYVRDDRPGGDPTPPAAVFFYSPDRKGERPADHLAHFSGFLQADTYAGFDALYGEQITVSS